MRGAVLLALAACVPEAHEIGTTIWTVALEEETRVAGGRSRHVAITGGGTVFVRAPDGAGVWSAGIDGPAINLAVDELGGVIVLHRAGMNPGTIASRLTRFGSDGVKSWSVDRADGANLSSTIVHDVRDATWVVTRGLDVDSRWERYSAAGVELGRGVLPFRAGTPASAALPGGGIAIHDSDGGLNAIDETAQVMWRLPDTGAFVVHDDGELTRLGDKRVERLDATRARRWQVGRNDRANGIAALEDGSVIITGGDSLGNTIVDDSPVIIRVDRDGKVERELAQDVDFVGVIRAPPGRGFRFARRQHHATAELVARDP